MNDISSKESNISADEYVNVLHYGIVIVLKDCSITNYKRFVKQVNNSLQWSHALEQWKTTRRNALNDWRVAGCPVNGHLKEELAKVRREYKKVIKAAKINCKTIKANRLRQSLQNGNSKKF